MVSHGRWVWSRRRCTFPWSRTSKQSREGSSADTRQQTQIQTQTSLEIHLIQTSGSTRTRTMMKWCKYVIAQILLFHLLSCTQLLLLLLLPLLLLPLLLLPLLLLPLLLLPLLRPIVVFPPSLPPARTGLRTQMHRRSFRGCVERSTGGHCGQQIGGDRGTPLG